MMMMMMMLMMMMMMLMIRGASLEHFDYDYFFDEA